MKSRTVGSGGDDADFPTWEAQIDNSQDETGTAIQSAKLTAAGTMTIDAASTARVYKMTADSSSELKTTLAADSRAKARLGDAGAGNWSLIISTSGVVVERMGVISVDTAGILIGSFAATFRRLGFESGDGAVSGQGIYFNGSSTSDVSIVSNCFFTGCGHSFSTGANSASAGTNKFYQNSGLCGSNTPGFGFHVPGDAYFYANVVQQTAAPIFANYQLRYQMYGDQNVAEDTSADDGSLTNAWNSKSGLFNVETAGSEDLSLASGSQGAYSVTDRSGTVADLATDIVGTSRTGTIDAGVWQTPAAAAPASHNLTLLGVGG